MIALAALLIVSSQPQAEPYIQVAASGARISLVSVSDDYSMRSWSPNGSMHQDWLSAADILEHRSKHSDPAHLKDKLRLVFQVRGSSTKSPTYRFEEGPFEVFESALIAEDWNEHSRQLTGLQISAAGKKAGAPEVADITLMFSDGQWETEGSYDRRSGKVDGNMTTPRVELRRIGGRTMVSMKARVKSLRPERFYQLFSFDASGKQIDNQGNSRNPFDAADLQSSYSRKGQQLGRVELRSRPFDTLVFKSVRLRPNR